MGSSVFLKTGNYAKKKKSDWASEKQPSDSTWFQNPNAGKQKS